MNRLIGSLTVALPLAGCAWVSGSVVELKGQICGQPVEFRLVDNKDRSGTDIAVKCGPDGGVTITTTDSSASAVTAAQAAALTDLAGVLAREAAAGALP